MHRNEILNQEIIFDRRRHFCWQPPRRVCLCWHKKKNSFFHWQRQRPEKKAKQQNSMTTKKKRKNSNQIDVCRFSFLLLRHLLALCFVELLLVCKIRNLFGHFISSLHFTTKMESKARLDYQL